MRLCLMETEAQKGQGGRSEGRMWWGWVCIQDFGVLSMVCFSLFLFPLSPLVQLRVNTWTGAFPE